VDLKLLIEREHELKPKPQDQRLVCGGKLGKDDQTVESFIENSTVIHLLCSQAEKKKEEEEAVSKKEEEDSRKSSEQQHECKFKTLRKRMTAHEKQQKQMRAEIREYMKWKGINKHPFLKITEKSKDKKQAETDENNNNLPQTPEAPPANNGNENPAPAPAAAAAAAPAAPEAQDEGFRIDWFDRIFYLIQMSFFGLMIFARTAMGSWWMFGCICLALVFVKLFVQGFFNPRRRNNNNQPEPDNNPPVDPNAPVPFGRVIITFFTSFFRSLIPEALPAGVQFQ